MKEKLQQSTPENQVTPIDNSKRRNVIQWLRMYLTPKFMQFAVVKSYGMFMIQHEIEWHFLVSHRFNVLW